MHKLFQALNFSNHAHEQLSSTLRKTPLLSLFSFFHAFTKKPVSDAELDFVSNEVDELKSSKLIEGTQLLEEQTDRREARNVGEMMVQGLHPWPEWVDMMECFLKRGYFQEDRNPFENAEFSKKDLNRIRTVCLNFARDQYDLIRYLSRKDIHIIAGFGCPSIDRKVVNSAKRLRAKMGIDEGNVCGSCNLRGECERAYMKARPDESGRTVDVMRILVTYTLDPIISTVENMPCLNKMVRDSVGRLLKEMVEYSHEELESDLPKLKDLKRFESVQDQSCSQGKDSIDVPMKHGDWLCPKCNFLNFARNVKCLGCDGVFEERLRQLIADLDNLPLKKGDWKCDKCNFLNFAKNSKCLQCKEKPSQRHLNPGEWECESCNYINFRKNMVCLRCDHRRAKVSSTPDNSTKLLEVNGGYRFGKQFDRSEADSRRKNCVNTWNFTENELGDPTPSMSSNGAFGFIDFPISGGTSELSRNAERRERWKVEMLEQSKGMVKAEKKENELGSDKFDSKLVFSGSTDDEEIAEWFGHRKGAER